jgi:hypothetical protein
MSVKTVPLHRTTSPSSTKQEFATSGITRLTINDAGNVGIGTTNPSETLHLNAGGGGPELRFQNASGSHYIRPYNDNWNFLANSTNTAMTIRNSGQVEFGGLVTAGTSTSNRGNNIRNWSTTGYVELSGDLPGYSNGDYPVLKSSSAYLYISVGNSYSSYISANGVYTVQSDVSLKTNINTLSSGQLNKITNLRGVSYNWIDENKGTETQIGLIAQEVEAEYPELVSEGAGDLKGVNYAGLVSPLIEAVKELKLELDAAKARITTLENA